MSPVEFGAEHWQPNGFHEFKQGKSKMAAHDLFHTDYLPLFGPLIFTLSV